MFIDRLPDDVYLEYRVRYPTFYFESSRLLGYLEVINDTDRSCIEIDNKSFVALSISAKDYRIYDMDKKSIAYLSDFEIAKKLAAEPMSTSYISTLSVIEL